MKLELKNLDIVLKLPQEKLKAIEGRFEQAVNDEVTRMVVRTRQGKDVNGQQFQAYTEPYAKFKRAKGRQVSPPDLTFKGTMLSAITTETRTEPNRMTIRVFFNSALEAAKAAGNMARRAFFGFSDEQVQRIKNKLQG